MNLVEKTCRLIIVCILLATECHAQNNPYHIKDNLYNSLKKIESNIQNKDALKMADTMFAEGAKLGDLKAQCIALYLRQDHYHAIQNREAEIREFNKVSPFILKTPYLQYYFGMWENIINQYINDKETVKAAEEISKFRKRALLLKSDYGIIESYNIQGNLYFHFYHYRLALAYYRLANDYNKSKNRPEDNNMLFRMARCCFYLRDWTEGMRYLNRILSDKNSEDFLTQTYSLLLSYDCNQTPMDSVKIEDDYKKLVHLQAQSPLLGNDMFIYNEAMYYYYHKYKADDKKADSFIDGRFHTQDYFTYYDDAIRYESIGDYKQAAANYGKYIERIDDMNADDEQFLVNEFVPQLDFYNVEHEKSILLHNNEMLKLQDLKKKQNILALIERKNFGTLITHKREHSILMDQLKAQSDSIAHQNRILKDKRIEYTQHAKAALLTESKDLWRMRFVWMTALAIITFLSFYIIENIFKRRQLKQEKTQSERTNYIKSMFFQNMNHEIRTPLNAISGFNDLLNGEMAGNLSADEKKEFIKMITINSELLMTLVNDVIELSNYKSGTYKIHLTDVDIEDVCYTVITSLRGKQNPGVELIFNPRGERHFILNTDAQRLQQVLTNYLTNACKHTDNGSIELSYEILPDIVRFAVSDTGEGIKEEDAEKVFERFNMLDTNKRGTGLGLHICKLIANVLHGKVYLDKAYNKGARFIFDHPRVLSLLLLLSLTFYTIKTDAVNKYGVNEKINALYEEAFRNINSKDGRIIGDKMYRMALKLKDKKALGLALLTQSYYYNNEDNNPYVMSKFKECKRVCIAAHVRDIMYDAWVNIVMVYLQTGQFKKAKVELVEMYKTTKKYNDTYGRGAYDYLAGNFYYVQRQYAAALFYLQQCIQYKLDDYGGPYSMIGQSYYHLHNYNKSVEYNEKSLKCSSSDLDSIYSLVMLMKCYCKLNKHDKAGEIMTMMKRIKWHQFSTPMQAFYHSGTFLYYSIIENDNIKAFREDSLGKVAINNYDHGIFYLKTGNYKKAWSALRTRATDETKWLATNYDDINNFYIGKFAFKESLREKDRMKLKNMTLQMVDAKNSHKLLILKHEHTIWLLKQDELIAKDRQGKLKLQDIMLEHKKTEYQKQYRAEKELKRQKKIKEERLKWKYSTIGIVSLCSLFAIFILIKRTRKNVIKLKEDAKKAKVEEQRKTAFFDNINRKIKEPINTIIGLNHKLNDNDNMNISDEERKSDVEKLDNKTSYLTDFINDLLIISKLESGTYKKLSENCEINRICSSVIEQLKAKDCVEFKSNTNGQNFVSDSNLIQMMLTSMLSYAIQQKERKGPVLMSSVMGYEWLTVSISCPGVQLSETEAENLFEFGETNQNADGNIALYKSKMIAQMLGGKVYADTFSNDGTTLSFEIPV